MKIIKHYTELTEKTQDKKIAYLKYRTGKVKHELWLKSRKSKSTVFITDYDNFILENLQP